MALDALDFEYADLPWDAAFIAGTAFTRCRQNGGVRRSPLPDFYIAAHALVSSRFLSPRFLADDLSQGFGHVGLLHR